MSATAKQYHREFPPHVEIVDGRVINREVSERQLWDLRDYAASARYDLEAACQSAYGYGSEWLSEAQEKEQSDAIFQRRREMLAREFHYHFCEMCNRSSLHSNAGCLRKHEPGNIDQECWNCRHDEHPTQSWLARHSWRTP